MTVRRLPHLLALVLGLLAALAVACGDEDDDRKLLPPRSASDIREELDTIAERVDRGECLDLEPAFIRLNRAVDELPRSVDRSLRRRLAEGVQNLEEIAPDECRDNRPETTTTETTPTETTTEPPETTTEPPETTTEPPPDTTTEPPPTEPPPTEPPAFDPGESGGEPAPGSGFVPPGQAKKGGKG